jgi:hypothetical protein
MKEELNQVDLAFVVDTTASMGPFIAAAQAQMITMARALLASADVNMRIGVVEYRDHPPQDRMVYRAHPMGDLRGAEEAIKHLRPQGGGDGPEAVLDGVLAACNELPWRVHARRVAVLVGDAPPHGIGAAGDHFRGGCPCGQTIESVTAAAEEARITLYALALHAYAADSFARLAKFTGGDVFAPGRGNDAIGRIQKILIDEFVNLRLDAQVLEEWTQRHSEFSIDRVAEKHSIGPGAVAASVTRLMARRFIQMDVEKKAVLT